MQDFVSSIQEIVFEAVNETEFSFPSVSCGYFGILEDKVAFEGDEWFLLELISSSMEVEGINSTVNVTIHDNDGKPSIFH